MNARQHALKGRVWLAITFVAAYAVIVLEPTGGPFKEPVVRGVSVFVAGITPYTMVMWHWLAAKKARRRGNPGAPFTPAERRRDQIIGSVLLIVGSLAVLIRFVLFPP